MRLLFPENFGTVDQFVVLDLLSIKDIKQKDKLILMNPDNIRLNDGVELIRIMKERAKELNEANCTNIWTPRHLIKYYGYTGLNSFHIVIITQNPFIPIAYSYPNLVDERYSSDGYNVGIEAAGKTMMHALSMHLTRL